MKTENHVETLHALYCVAAGLVGVHPTFVKALFSCGTGILPVPWQTGETPVPQEVYLRQTGEMPVPQEVYLHP